MKFHYKLIATILVAGFSAQSNAALTFDQDLAGGVVFGSGNANGGFTVDTQNSVEIGLRAKVRFDDNNSPQNIFNSNGDGTYSFDAIAPSPGFGWLPNSSSTAAWNFEWSVDVSGTGEALDAFTYLFEIDFDPTSGTDFLAFDPINTINANDNAGGPGVAQNSWNMEFFNQPGLFDYLNTTNGEFDFRLSAYDGATLLASSTITVFQRAAVPEPGTLALMLLAGFGLVVNKKFKK